MQLVVATVGRAHGIRGEVSLDLRTDEPHTRFVPGAVFVTQPDVGELTVVRVRGGQRRLLVVFAQVSDRTAAESLRGTELLVEVDASTEDDAWYPHELAGLRVEGTDGRALGTVLGLEHSPGHDLLIIREADGRRTLVPFVKAIVPVVDVDRGRIILDPPGGLLGADGAAGDTP